MTNLSDGSTMGKYPSGQKARTAESDEIKAKVFRERDAKSKSENTGPPRGYETQPKD